MAGTLPNPSADGFRFEPGWHSTLLDGLGIRHWFSANPSPDPAWIATQLAGLGAVPARVRQVHGALCVEATTCASAPAAPEGDAVISADRRFIPIIATADCVPVLVCCMSTGCVGAIHAGWRGIVAGVVGAAVQQMCRVHGARPEAMVAACGPCAGPRRYEVGIDVIDEFARVGLASRILNRSGPKAFADCAGAVCDQLVSCGVPASMVDHSAPCTIENDKYASHRREPLNPARMLAGIAPLA